MPTVQEYNQFKRLVGDFGQNKIASHEIDTYLDDATFEVTADFVQITTQSPVLDSPQFNQYENFTSVDSAPIRKFDELYHQFHPEVIYKAAINWWWNRASDLATRLSTTVGAASQNVSDLYDKAMTMIANLEEKYESVQQLGLDIQMGNFSYFSKRNLRRVGGQREENSLLQGEGDQPGDLWYG